MSEPRRFTEDQVQRYSRHIILPNVGAAGQRKLLDSSVLIIGAGGLGSPIAMYLAAAGVGHDRHRRLRRRRRLEPPAPDPPHERRRRPIEGRVGPRAPPRDQPDGRDRRPRHPAVLDERVRRDGALRRDRRRHRQLPGPLPRERRHPVPGKPLVYGSIYQFEGQATVFMPGKETPCYRCLFPTPPPPGTVPSCAEGGVFGVLPGVIGSIQATEAIKLLTGEGEHARRPAAPLRRPRHELPGSEDPLGRRLPGVRQGADHHRADRLRAVLRRSRPARVRSIHDMPVQVKLPTILRKHAGGEPKVSAEGATLRDVLDDLESKYPGITKNVRVRGRRAPPVHQRLSERRGRALPRLLGDRGGRGRHRLDPSRRRRRVGPALASVSVSLRAMASSRFGDADANVPAS